MLAAAARDAISRIAGRSATAARNSATGIAQPSPSTLTTARRSAFIVPIAPMIPTAPSGPMVRLSLSSPSAMWVMRETRPVSRKTIRSIRSCCW